MLATEVGTIQRIWPTMASIMSVPHTETEYQRLVTVLDSLIDLVGEDETHPLASLMELLGVLIEKYETEHFLEPTDW